MRLTSRRSDDDADVIRARLRALLHEGDADGWLPAEDLELPSGSLPVADPEAGNLGPVRAWQLPARDGPDAASDGGPENDPDGVPAGIGRHRAPGPAVRLDPGRRGAWSLWVAGLIGVLILLAWTWLDRPRVHQLPRPAGAATGSPSVSSAPKSPPVGEAARTSTTVVVSVVGRVARPGLVTLSTGSRIADAIEAAGGLLPGTDPATVNLAAVVTDGQQIPVGVPGASTAAAGQSSAAGPIDLNAATSGDLDGLPGIGPVLAQRIVDFRQQHGRFTSVDQLNDVPGIGPALYARLSALVRV